MCVLLYRAKGYVCGGSGEFNKFTNGGSLNITPDKTNSQATTLFTQLAFKVPLCKSDTKPMKEQEKLLYSTRFSKPLSSLYLKIQAATLDPVSLGVSLIELSGIYL